MSDNLPPEVVRQELEARFRIPTEVWTDVFKLLPRRVLVQQIAPVCYYFKEISNKNVKNVHVIEDADQFTKKLEDDDPEANQQLEHLAANGSLLASQFKLYNMQISEKNQAILQHCPDLFNGCQIFLYFGFGEENKDSKLFLETLAELEKTKPVEIRVMQRVDQVIDFWHHSTFQSCSRIELNFWSELSDAAMMIEFVNIFEWIHHEPIGTDCDHAAHQHVRCMIISSPTEEPVHIDWLLDRCSKDIQQAQDATDRRLFVFSFECWDEEWTGFDQFRRIENKKTGEVLVLDHLVDKNGEHGQYRLRRCLTEEEANRKELYAGMFKRDRGYDEFKIDEETPEVMIGEVMIG